MRGTPPPLRRRLWLAYASSALIAAVMATASVIGLMFGGRGLYGAGPELLPAFLGQDLLNLVVGVPVLLGSMSLASRGSLAGMLAWPGALFYVTYDYGFYVLAAPFGPLFLAYIALVTLSAYTTIGILLSIDADRVARRLGGSIPERATGGTLVALALLFTALWTMLTLTGLASGAGLEPIPRTVVIMDFTVQLPALLVGGVLLWRSQALGYVVAPGLLLQMAGYLLGLSAICILGRDATGALVTPAAYLPGLVVGAAALALMGYIVRAAEGPPVAARGGAVA